ncbi:MAG: folate-binding protein, partial [Gammaproteobacteria bacterium]
RLQAVWQALASEVTPVGAGPWALLDILAGVPSIYPATSEAFLPQMLNLHALGALSFQKGCFPGQEVIARVKYRGKLKRRTYLAHLDTDAVPDPGDALFEVRSRERIGQVLNARPHPDGGIAMLAVIETEAAASTEVRLHRDEGPTVQVQPLPYSLNAA